MKTTCTVCNSTNVMGNWIGKILLGIFCLDCERYFEKPRDKDVAELKQATMQL